MRLKNKNEPFILDGFSYNEIEEARAKEIRIMEDGERKDFRIKYFEIETGKEFPACEPVEIKLNIDTAFMSSLEIESGAVQVIMNAIRSRSRIPL